MRNASLGGTEGKARSGARGREAGRGATGSARWTSRLPWISTLELASPEDFSATPPPLGFPFVILFIFQSHLSIACVSVCTAPLRSHACCVYYDSRLDPPRITSSPSRWHGQAGDEQEGNYLMAFLMRLEEGGGL